MEKTPAAPKKVAAKKPAPAAVPVDDKPVLRRTLEHGEKGPAVLYAQQRLQEQGFFEKEPDGRFGTIMAKAVRRWQEANGLKMTGVISHRDWMHL